MTNPYLENTSQRQPAPQFPEQRMLEEKIVFPAWSLHSFLSELSAMLPTCQLLPFWKAETMGIQEVLSLILKCEFISLSTYQNQSCISLLYRWGNGGTKTMPYLRSDKESLTEPRVQLLPYHEFLSFIISSQNTTGSGSPWHPVPQHSLFHLL